MRWLLPAIAAAVLLVSAGSGGAGAETRSLHQHQVATSYPAAAGHRISGFALDRDWLVIAEDPAAPGTCPAVVLVRVPSGKPRQLTRPGGESCRFGGHFWVRPGMRAIGNAITKALWVLRRGSVAEAVKASPTEPEALLERRTGITADRGPFLGPVVATNWLRLFGDYTRGMDGVLVGGAISANDRELWASSGPVVPFGLDDAEHAVTVGADGSIAMWQAHGAHYGVVPDAHARAAALDDGEVLVLRSDLPQLDIRLLSGAIVRSWPIARDAKPLLDADVRGNAAVYLAGRAVHELRLDDGRDTVVARAPRGSTLLDVQIEQHFLAYAYRGGPGGPGRVVVLRR